MGLVQSQLRNIARTQDEVAALDYPGGIGAAAGGVLGDLITMFRTPSRQRLSQQAKLAQMAEVMAPRIAKERGISLDEARNVVMGGVAEPEAPGMALIHSLGIGEAPQGEPYEMRLARLSGTAGRYLEDDHTKDEALQRVGALTRLAHTLQDPSPLVPALKAAYAEAGMGDVGEIKLRPDIHGIWDALQYAPDLATKYGEITKDSRATHYPSADEEIIKSLDQGNEGRAKKIREYTSPPKEPKNTTPDWTKNPLLKARVEQYAMSHGDAMDAEQSALAKWESGGRRGARPKTPALDGYNALERQYNPAAGGAATPGNESMAAPDPVSSKISEALAVVRHGRTAPPATVGGAPGEVSQDVLPSDVEARPGESIVDDRVNGGGLPVGVPVQGQVPTNLRNARGASVKAGTPATIINMGQEIHYRVGSDTFVVDNPGGATVDAPAAAPLAPKPQKGQRGNPLARLGGPNGIR